MRSSKYLLLCAAALSSPVFAQAADKVVSADPVRDELIVVTATGQAENLTHTGQSISVVSQEEIARVQAVAVSDVLTRLPGVTVTRNGTPGGFTGVRVRGSGAEQVLVLVDGVKVNDASSPGGGYDFGNLLAGGYGKIELLRGSNSTIWGSQALGGVVAVSTAENDGLASVQAEGGSFGTWLANASISPDLGPVALDLSGGYYTTDGYSSAEVGSEDDGFRQWHVQGRALTEVTSGLALDLRGRFADSRLDLDGFAPPTYAFGDTDEYQDTQEWSGYAGLNYASDMAELTASYGISNIERENYDRAFPGAPLFTSEGRTERYTLRAIVPFGDALSIHAGGEQEESRYDTGGPSASANITSVYGMVSLDSEPVHASVGVRRDDHNVFGGETSIGADASVNLFDDWRARASYGEGFKAPTLYQLSDRQYDYGNPDLTPETAKSYDIGIEKGFRQGALHLALTLFQRDTRNLIDFVSCSADIAICNDVDGAGAPLRPFGTYGNVSKARARGVEVELGARIAERLTGQAAYSYVESKNRTADSANFGNDLARRPRHALTTSLDYSFGQVGRGPAIGADLRMVGDSFDDNFNATPLDGYAVVAVRASLPVGEAFELYGRVENLFDEDYQTVAGYSTSGRAGYIGIRARLP